MDVLVSDMSHERGTAVNQAKQLSVATFEVLYPGHCSDVMHSELF